MTSFHSVAVAIAQTTAFLTLAIAPATAVSTDITATAKNLTVALEGCSSSFGLIVDRQDSLYSLLVPTSQINNPQKTCWVKLPDGDIQQLNATPTEKQLVGFDLTLMKFKSDRDYAVANLEQVNLPETGDTIYLAGIDAGNNHQFTLTHVEVTADLEQSDRLTYQIPTTHEGSLGRGPIFNAQGEAIGFQTSNQEGIAISKSLAMLLYSPQVQVDSLPRDENLPASPPSEAELPAAARTPEQKSAPTPKPKPGLENSINAAINEANAHSLTDGEKASLSQQMLLSDRQGEEKSGFPVELLLIGMGLCGVVAVLYKM